MNSAIILGAFVGYMLALLFLNWLDERRHQKEMKRIRESFCASMRDDLAKYLSQTGPSTITNATSCSGIPDPRHDWRRNI